MTGHQRFRLPVADYHRCAAISSADRTTRPSLGGLFGIVMAGDGRFILQKNVCNHKLSRKLSRRQEQRRNMDHTFQLFQLYLWLSIKLCLWRPSDSQTTARQTPWAKLYPSHTVSETIFFARVNHTSRRGDGLVNHVWLADSAVCKDQFSTSVPWLWILWHM
jgi:hypothetical protein